MILSLVKEGLVGTWHAKILRRPPTFGQGKDPKIRRRKLDENTEALDFDSVERGEATFHGSV